MITNLPNTIDPRILRNFTMGSVEAPEDGLLWDCFCRTSSIERFLDGTKDILTGAKGAGKSAIFTLLKRRKIGFLNQNNYRQYIVPIDQQVEYSKLKAQIIRSLKSDIEDEDTRYRFLWEIYVLYRICVQMQRHGLADNDALSREIEGFVSIFAASTDTPTLLQLLLSSKKSVGVKLNTTNPAFPTPDFYISVEPSQNASAVPTTAPAKFEIDGLRKSINKCLRRKKSVIYVLIDNIDDFVAREEYQIQKLLLQGLVQTTRDYSSYPHLKVKLFLRTELYNKLNFSQLGGVDKIAPRTIHLTWTDADIRRFVGERVLYNLSRQLAVRPFRFNLDGASITLDRKDGTGSWWQRALALIMSFGGLRKRDARDARTIDDYDRVFGDAITAIFPRQVHHFDGAGEQRSQSIFEYLSTHFALANRETTPRIVLLFLEKVFSIAADYYAKNPTLAMNLDKRGEFPLIMRGHVVQAYSELQDDMIEICKSSITHEAWRKMLEVFLQRKRQKVAFSFGALQKLIGVEEDEEMKEFLAYIGHLGVLACRDKSVLLKQRHYELPLILQNNWYREGRTHKPPSSSGDGPTATQHLA